MATSNYDMISCTLMKKPLNLSKFSMEITAKAFTRFLSKTTLRFGSGKRDCLKKLLNFSLKKIKWKSRSSSLLMVPRQLQYAAKWSITFQTKTTKKTNFYFKRPVNIKKGLLVWLNSFFLTKWGNSEQICNWLLKPSKAVLCIMLSLTRIRWWWEKKRNNELQS